MTSTDQHLEDVKTMLLGIGITQAGIAFGIAAMVLNSAIAVPLAVLATGVGLLWIASGYRENE
ncbi:hypothetical protein [Halococcus sp. IIIV-5B]|uniref:hypothetical protein n=1 Tax=Halococcus sp. IIIV-5B TaxID=2321230 RepID=UPI000E7506D7|nr:hypothetical protein [Halococcus sp. IIIV-5B]RJT06515.1 hypothetical protein D3261_05480 [Halococcus sp. IIIV-5B]